METPRDAPLSYPEDPMWLRYRHEFAEHYHEVFYQASPIIRHVQESAHRTMERPFRSDRQFPRVLEVGAGAGEHLPFVRHGFEHYLMIDLDEAILEQARQNARHRPEVECRVMDARNLAFPDHYFDRLISVFNLEHLSEPYRVLREWARVVRPGGVISIAIPTEGGMAWELGRTLTTRRIFRKKGFDWDYIVARDHVNSCRQILSFVRHDFPNRREYWYPLGLPNHHINLTFTCNLFLEKP
ncbi:MAG: class I SAM-dependent methyltransferase [Magnetococcales bacterium]|nr:class I SAM-dependent methyltransferase [Magnetococcales bacterium]